MGTIKFIEDGDRFICIAAPIREMGREIGEIKNIFSGAPEEKLQMSVPYKYKGDVSSPAPVSAPQAPVTSSLQPPVQASLEEKIFYYRYLFRKGLNKQIQIYQNMDNLYPQLKDDKAYIKAVIKEFEEEPERLKKFCKPIAIAMPNIIGPAIEFSKIQVAQAQVPNDEFINSQSEANVLSIIEGGALNNLKRKI